MEHSLGFLDLLNSEMLQLAKRVLQWLPYLHYGSFVWSGFDWV